MKEVFLLQCGLGIVRMSGRNGISESLSYLVPAAGAEGSAMGHVTRALTPLSSHFHTCKKWCTFPVGQVAAYSSLQLNESILLASGELDADRRASRI